MPAFYTDGQRALQRELETTKMADLRQQVIVHGGVQDTERAFIESRDLFFLATVDDRGQPTCSYKGGDPGFVKVLDPRTLLFPIYDGNGMFLSAGIEPGLLAGDAGRTAKAGGTMEYEAKLAAGQA